MGGKAGAALANAPAPRLDRVLALMSTLTAHRGPGGFGFWKDPHSHVSRRI